MKKKLFFVFWVVTFGWIGCFGAEDSISLERVQGVFEKPIPAHPRLFLNDDECTSLQEQIKQHPRMQTYADALAKKADGILKQKTVRRKLQGRRLLSESRRCLDRVFALSMVYRLTDKEVYLKRAEREMLAAAGFSDWNPSHFLDVAEMTAALAIGYDWLYDELSESSRQKIRQAIRLKGLEPSLNATYNHWLRGHNNWNQVCNGGMTLGALAIYEDDPEFAQELVHRAVNSVPLAMRAYEPDGAYPEGPGYWEYGTSYNVMLITSLESVLGTDFGLSEYSGFVNSADYILHVTGPTGLFFNYPDSGVNKSFSPTPFWFADRLDKPYLVWNEYRHWTNADTADGLVSERLAPLFLCWFAGQPTEPQKTCWMGQGVSSVAMFRTSWTDPDAMYLGIKGGSPSAPHGHMDVGSFVLDAKGVRWAVDLGPESYHKIESRGMKLWGRDQDAQRWTIFRYNNLSHNTLVVNGQHQRVEGQSPIVRYSDDPDFSHAVFDMSAVYEGQLKSAYRGGALLGSGQVLIQDDLEGLDRAVTVRWAMVTPAKVSIKSARQAVLKQDGNTLDFRVLGDAAVQLAIYSTQPKAEWDAPNPDTRMIGFEVDLAAGQKQSIGVLMTPGPENPSELKLRPVLSWSDELKEVPDAAGSGK